MAKEIAKYNRVFILESDRYIQDDNKKFQNISVDYFKEFYILQNPLSPFLDFNPSFIIKLFHMLLQEKIDLIQVSFPYGILITRLLIKLTKKEVILVYDSHNVEGDLIRNIFFSNRNFFLKHFLYFYIKCIERFSVQLVDHIIVVSSDDRDLFLKIYGIDSSKISVIPTGAMIRTLHRTENKAITKKRIGVEDEKTVVLFHGTYSYLPNKQAVDLILKYIAPEIEKRFPDAVFVVAGSGSPKFRRANIISLGFVEDLELLLQAADIAIVPIQIGGGTRIKILDYMGSGIPVLSTEKGIEGISAENHRSAEIVKNVDNEFLDVLELLLIDKNLRLEIGYNGYKLVKEQFDWNNISRNLDLLYNKLTQSTSHQNSRYKNP